MRNHIALYIALALLGVAECSAYNTPLTKDNIAAQLQELNDDQALAQDKNPAVGVRYNGAKKIMETAKSACEANRPDCEELLKTANTSLTKLLGTRVGGQIAPPNAPQGTESGPSLKQGISDSTMQAQIMTLKQQFKDIDELYAKIIAARPAQLTESERGKDLATFQTQQAKCNKQFGDTNKDKKELESCVADMVQLIPKLTRIKEEAELKSAAGLGGVVNPNVSKQLQGGKIVRGTTKPVSSLGSRR